MIIISLCVSVENLFLFFVAVQNKQMQDEVMKECNKNEK